MKYIKWMGKILLYIVILLWTTFKFALIVSKNKDRKIMKFRLYNRLLMDWITSLENNRSIYDCLKEKGFMNIAVYGRRGIGERLRMQLEKTDVSLKYFIDRVVYQADTGQAPIYCLDDELPMVDAIIVTPIWDYENICKLLSKKVNYPIISIQDIITGEKR